MEHAVTPIDSAPSPEPAPVADEQADSGVALADERLALGAEVLRQLLARARDGGVSTQALRKELDARSIPEPQELIARLKSVERNVERGYTWYHIGRSFLTESKYREAQRTQEVEARQAEVANEVAGDEDDGDSEEEPEVSAPRERKKRRREEGRLGAYIVPFLEEIYDDEASPDTYVFDVHSMRGGTDFENVDLLAMHWRSAKCVDVVASSRSLLKLEGGGSTRPRGNLGVQPRKEPPCRRVPRNPRRAKGRC